MELIRWTPARDIFGRGFLAHRLLNDFFSPDWTEANEADLVKTPRVDIYEEKDHFVINAELPGLAKKDIAIDVKDRILTLKGERTAEKNTDDNGYSHRERSYGKFERAFTLPDDVLTEKISADYKDGVLKIQVPKSPKSKPRQITIH